MFRKWMRTMGIEPAGRLGLQMSSDFVDVIAMIQHHQMHMVVQNG
ncbi:MAG: hypothetical protein SH868_16385 [Bythopirellula sp.]|nr:hypothetical protein [Bythopirellula sp.]